MHQFFDYKHIQIDFNFDTKSIKAAILPEFLTNDLLSELENFFNWLASKKEVHSVLLSSHNDFFSKGINPKELKAMEPEDLQLYSSKVYKLSLAMLYLPQCFIIDAKKGASNFAIELMAGADLRVAASNAKFHLNHLGLGLLPASGGMSILASDLPSAFFKALSSGFNKDVKSLISIGWLASSYTQKDHSKSIQSVLKEIYSQSPVERVQLKSFLNQDRIVQIKDLRQKEVRYFKACLITQDWQDSKSSMPLKHFSTAVRVAKERMSSVAS